MADVPARCYAPFPSSAKAPFVAPANTSRSGRVRARALVKDKSVVLEEYATRLVAAEAIHLREMELMLMKRAPD